MFNDNPNIDVITASAKFVSDKVVEIVQDNQKELLTADIIVINTGSKPNILPIKGLSESKYVYDSTAIQQLSTLPKSLGIIGAGNIGLEFANIFARSGCQVTVFDSTDAILKKEEPIVSTLAQKYLEEDGVTFKFNCQIEAVFNRDENVVVKIGEQEMVFEALMHATGRKANTDDLGLQNTNIALNNRGNIVVDDHCQTTVSGVFALGDVAGSLQFTYTSLDDYRVLASYLLSDGSYNLTKRNNVPYTIFLSPSLSRVGLTEQQALAQGYDILVKEHYVKNMPRHAIDGNDRGIFKAIVDKNTGLILGTTLFAKNSEELINLIKMAIDNKISYTYLKNQIFTHPNMAENLNDLFNM